MIELTFYRIRKSFGDNLLLNNIGFTLYDKERVALVGANGTGKSTILKLIAGIEPFDRDDREDTRQNRDKGWMKISKGASVGYLNQLPNYNETFKVQEILKLAFEEIYSIERELRKLELIMTTLESSELEKTLKTYSRLQEAYEAKGGYDIEEKLSKICKGLKFNDAFLNKEFGILSGGEKTTVSLGKLLLESPDILLLDEPTNHLDMDSIEWLEGYLKSYVGIVFIVSHDRYFLDSVVTKVIELENKKNIIYKGNYSDYLKQKEDNMLQQFNDHKDQQSKIKAMEAAAKNLRLWGQFSRALSIEKRLEKLDIIEKPIFEKKNMKFNFLETERSAFHVIKGNGICKSFNDRVLLKNCTLNITMGERVALIGPNGSGKTTFLNMLLGATTLDSGTLALGSNVKFAYLPQNIVFNNDEDRVIDCFREDKLILEGKAREYLSKFMFFGKTVYQQVKHLSGGERVRLKLSMLLYDEINLLVLDEPTNHLDIDSIENLESALEDFNGTILFISHDRYFINKVCNRIIAIEDTKLVSYDGDYDFYRNSKNNITEENHQLAITQNKTYKKVVTTEDKKLTSYINKLYNDIKSLENELINLDFLLADSSSNYDELSKLYSKKEKLNIELEKLMTEWFEFDNNNTANSI